MKLTVLPEEAGGRLDRFLSARLGVSRADALRLLEAGLISCNSRPLSQKAKGHKVAAGDVIAVRQLSALTQLTPNPTMPLPILAATRDFIIIDKPAGLPVRPQRLQETTTVLNAVVARYPQLQGIGEGGLRSGVVHRLDTETSGALAVALTEAGWRRLRRDFTERQAEKIYHAIVEGHCQPQASVALELVVSQHHPARVTVVAAPTHQSRHCRLSYRTLKLLKGATLIEVRLETGFLHQIRVTMAHLGHPIIGDVHYGATLAAPRPLLHAARLTVAGVTAISPTPPDFKATLAQLALDETP
jgi:23S rRNA pseudouridine1911/1915/1917 synthase